MQEPHRCPRCQSELLSDAPEGLCPECLYQQAIKAPSPPLDHPEDGRSPHPGFVPPAPADLARHFPQLEILEILGQGGMGAVYKARQTKLDRLVAVKILPPEVARDPAFAERFMREARSLARLNHPHIVTIFDFGETDGYYYFSMEYVDGKNVRELLEAGDLPASLALKIVPQVCDALHYAHDEGIVHRDIKPENILLDRKGRVKIADFGLAKLVGLTPAYLTLTGAHEVMGTLYYMAPEQMQRSHLVDHRADLYSLGVVFYEMLTGELPLGRFAPPSHKARVHKRLDPVVLRALAREPEHRYQDASALKKDVESALAGSPAAPEVVPSVQPVAGGPAGNWPVVRFTIPDISWLGQQARGEIYRDEEALILEFVETNWLGTAARSKHIRIPFAEIAALSCRAESWSKVQGVPGMPKWLGEWAPREIVIKTVHPRTLEGLPAGKHGKGRLLIHRADRAAANELVDSVVERSYARSVGSGQEADQEGRQGQGFAAERIRMEIMAPAVGLLATGLVAAVSCVWGLAVILREAGRGDLPRWSAVLWLIPVLMAAWGVAYLLTGFWHMIRLRSYPLALTAAVLAVVPWSPGWILGLPFGIWCLLVLCRRDVRAAFLHNQRPAAARFERMPRPAVLVAGKIGSLFRSVAGYIVPTFVAWKARSTASGANPDGHPNAARRPQPGGTVDYSAGPGGDGADSQRA